ncbi:terpene synthase family protein [Streptomyces xantholiticus]|uniref:terpene synthase family protein n=1 Tax=Streptomyces xantholiticus TaxID=68285 RepID=UPI001671C416|nr:terpene synthase family protein [Streptomyces xantholiticus]GGW38900.1 hypothetical protein GCM10010381_24420 [Streptomyces xantholiticus]
MALLDSFTIPDFYLPFESAKHPQSGRANSEATSWALRHGLITDAAEQFAGIGFGHLSGRVCQEAPYRHVVLLAEWMAWSFVLDDQHDHLIRAERLEAWPPLTDAITGYLATGQVDSAPQLRENPLVVGFIDLCDRILSEMPTTIRERYRAHIPLMLRSLDQEAVNRNAAQQPTIEDYVRMRRHSSQLLPMMDMVEAGLGVEVPPEVYDSSAFQDLMSSALDVISWGNDVFSLRKEFSCGDNNNLVSLLAWWNECSLPEAVLAVQERTRSRVEDFLTAAQGLPDVLDTLGVTDPSARAGVARCVKSYQDWMIGADLWQRYECTRYNDERWVAGLESTYTRPDLVPGI